MPKNKESEEVPAMVVHSRYLLLAVLDGEL